MARRLLRSGWLWAGLMLATLTATGLLLGWLYARSSRYEWIVSAKVLLQIGRETASARPSMVGAGQGALLSGNPRREDVHTEVELLGNLSLARRVFEELSSQEPRVISEYASDSTDSAFGRLRLRLRTWMEEIGVAPVRTPAERAFDRWCQAIKVLAVAGSNVLEVQCKTVAPDLGKRFLERMLALYMADHMRAFGADGSELALAAQVEAHDRRIAECESKLSEIRLKSGVANLAEEKSVWLRNKAEAEMRERGLMASVASASARVSDLAEELAKVPEQLILSQEKRRSQLRDDLDLRLAQLEQDLIVAEANFPADSPNVRRAREARDRMKRQFATVPDQRNEIEVLGRNPLHLTLRESWIKANNEFKGLEAELTVVRATIETAGQRLVCLEQVRAQLEKADRDLAEAKKDLDQAMIGQRMARLNRAMDEQQVSNVSIIAQPECLAGPVKLMGMPHRTAITLGGGAAGFLLAVVALMVWSGRARP